ncbi:MAG TPA: hypothetical protein VLA12_02465 [Planctomycetaceae bacterium]|nr:hypothetical protein [Planctomycetaceae bacterium]
MNVLRQILCFLGVGTSLLAQPLEPIGIDDPIPVGQPPVDYESVQTSDAFAKWREQIETDQGKLTADESGSYLGTLLKTFNISPHSQLLVFSKTSLNVPLISPENPRAIYFNDELYVGWVPGAAAFELMSFDPRKGSMFYTLSQEGDAVPRLQREHRCLTCHLSGMTRGVPGPMLRSLKTAAGGKPHSGYSGITHASDYFKRWGGWYVTGAPAGFHHSGNIFGVERIEEHRLQPDLHGQYDTLDSFFDVTKHIVPTSDVLPHLVLDHQVEAQNLIVRVHHEHLYRKRSDAEERLVRYLLLLDEPAFPVPITGNQQYAEWYESQGPQDEQGRSLREFDLETRLFKYRCSPLVVSPLFASLPEEPRRRIAGRIEEVLSGKSPEANAIPIEQRTETLELLRKLSPDFRKEKPDSSR